MSSPPAAPLQRLLPIFLGQAFGLGCGLIGVRLSSHLIPPETFGRYGVFLTFTSLGMWVVYAGLMKYVARHWADSTARPALLRATLLAGARKWPWLAIGCGAVAWLDRDASLAVFAALLFTATLLSFSTLAQTALQAARQHWSDFAVVAVAALTRSFGPPLLYAFAGGTFLALVTGFGFHALAAAPVAAWLLSRHLRAAPATATPKDGGNAQENVPPIYDGPLFIGLALAGWALLGANRWIAAWFFPAETAGHVALAVNLAALVPSVLGTVLLQYFQPGFFAAPTDTPAARRALAGAVDRAALLHAALSVAGLTALRAIAPWLMGTLIGEAYRPALTWFLPIGAASLTIVTGYFYHALLLAGQRERACGPVELTAAAVLLIGGVASAAVSPQWFSNWLLFSPMIAWLLTRTLARRYFFTAA